MKSNEVVKNLTNHILFLLILGYILFGTIVYTSWVSGYGNTITIALSVLSNLNYLTIFWFPSFLLLTSYIYKKMTEINFISRFSTRKEYFRFLHTISFKCNTLLFIMCLLLTFIAINLLGVTNIKVEQISYANNFTMLMVQFLKLYIFIYIFQRFIILVHIKCVNSNHANMIAFLFLALLYTSKYFLINTNNVWLNSLIPTNQLSDISLFFLPNLWINMIGACVLFGIFYIICFIIFHKVSEKKEFLERE